MPLELEDHECAALVELLFDTIQNDRFPLSPRVKRLRAILAKIRVAMPYDAPPGERSLAMSRKRRR